MKTDNGKKFIVCYLLIVCIGISTLVTCVTCKDATKNMSSKKIESIKNKPVTHYKDSKGIDHAEKQVVIANAETINAHYNHIIDSLTKLLHAKRNSIQSVASISTSTDEIFSPEIKYVPVDTCSTSFPDSVLFSDKYFSLQGSIKTDSFHYHTSDSLTFTTYFKNRELLLDAFSQNPNSTIKGITAVNLHQAKQSNFGIGFTAGCAWNGREINAAASVGVTWLPIHFR